MTMSTGVKARGHEAPAWAQGDFDENTFIGIASRAETEEEALDNAVAAVQVQLVQALGLVVSSSFFMRHQLIQENETETESLSIDKRIHAEARTLIQIKPDKQETRRICHTESEGQKCHWKAWVRIRFEPDTRARWLKEYVDVLANELHEAQKRGDTALNKGMLGRALTEYGDAGSIGVDFLTLDGIPGDLRRRIRSARKQMTDRIGEVVSNFKLEFKPARYRGLRRGLSTAVFHIEGRMMDGRSVGGVPIRFRWSIPEQEPIPGTRLDIRGKTQIKPGKPATRSPDYFLKAFPDLSSVEDFGDFPVTPAVLHFHTRQGSIKMVWSPTRLPDQCGLWRDGIRQALEKRDYRILLDNSNEDSDYVLKIVFSCSGEPARPSRVSFKLLMSSGRMLWSWSYPDHRFSPQRGGVRQERLIWEWIASCIEASS